MMGLRNRGRYGPDVSLADHFQGPPVAAPCDPAGRTSTVAQRISAAKVSHCCKFH